MLKLSPPDGKTRNFGPLHLDSATIHNEFDIKYWPCSVFKRRNKKYTGKPRRIYNSYACY